MDELQRSLLNVFTYSDLDREVRYRKQNKTMQKYLNLPSARFIVFLDDRFLAKVDGSCRHAQLTGDELRPVQCEQSTLVYLGSKSSLRLFAVQISDSKHEHQLCEGGLEFVGLRESGESMKHEDATLIAYAKAMFHWHKAHRFCGRCGCRTQSQQGGHARKCTNTDCSATHFPRTDPAIIVAVINEGQCLFGRQKLWPEHRYSVIAGFVEPAESIEQAVVREVREETDIRIQTVHYHSSQPWPFPGSIMLGFTATACGFDIRLNDGELQDAHWRSVSQVVDGIRDGSFRLPPKLSIAYRLIEDWFDAHSSERLADILQVLQPSDNW